MHCWIELDGKALVHNYQALAAAAAPAIAVPVVKSNAYGHGLREIVGLLLTMQPEWIAVNYLFEARTIRDLGYQGRILCVGPLLPDELSAAFEDEVDIFIGYEDLLAAWLATSRKPRAHIKIDTGMGRQGFYAEHASTIAERLKPHATSVIGLASHFANVEDVTKHTYADTQLNRFASAFDTFTKHGFNLIPHIASSASSIILPKSRYSLTRIGISLYGQWPSSATKLSHFAMKGEELTLKPVLSWRTRIIGTKEVPAFEYIGYGCTYRSNHPMRVAVLPVGYNEGYPRLAGSKGSYVLVRGSRCPIVGRLCMNMMMIDVTHLPPLPTGERVTLIGADGDEFLDAAQVAAWADTIDYELLTKLNPQMPRKIQ